MSAHEPGPRNHDCTVLDPQTQELLYDAEQLGMHVTEFRGNHDPDGAGITSHRGVLRGDKHVDQDVVRAAVEDRLGFTVAEFTTVMRSRTSAGRERRLVMARQLARLDNAAEGGMDRTILATVLGCTPQTIYNLIVDGRSSDPSS